MGNWKAERNSNGIPNRTADAGPLSRPQRKALCDDNRVSLWGAVVQAPTTQASLHVPAGHNRFGATRERLIVRLPLPQAGRLLLC